MNPGGETHAQKSAMPAGQATEHSLVGFTPSELHGDSKTIHEMVLMAEFHCRGLVLSPSLLLLFP